MEIEAKIDKLLEGVPKADVYNLCHLLMLKRLVDGCNGRPWNAMKHYDYDSSVHEMLVQYNFEK